MDVCVCVCWIAALLREMDVKFQKLGKNKVFWIGNVDLVSDFYFFTFQFFKIIFFIWSLNLSAA